jgi:hypothetical protein
MSLYRSGAGIHSWTQLSCIAWFDALQFHEQLPGDLLYGERHGGRQSSWGLGGEGTVRQGRAPYRNAAA